MRVASFANVAPLHIYHLKNGQVQKAVDFASRSTWGRVSLKVALVLRTHGYMPIGVLIWFAIWSVGSSYYDTRGWTTGYYGKRRLAGVIAVLAGFHFLFRFLCYVVLAENGQISWSGVFAVVAIMLIPNFLLVIRSVDTAQLYSLLVRWMYEHVIMRSYRDPVSLVAVLVFHNSRASLQQAWDRVLAEIRSAPLRTQLCDEVTLALEQAPSPLEARRVYARMLIQRLPWAQLVEQGLVPKGAQDPNSVTDIEGKIEEATRLLLAHTIGPKDLDRYIRERLQNQSADLKGQYESLLAASDESNERSALRVRMSFLGLELGQALTPKDIGVLIEEIQHSKQSTAATEIGVQPQGVAQPSFQVRRLVLRNIRCFRDLDLDFTSKDGTRPWTILLGDNGLGKTTILRSIAMALCDETNAAALMRRLSGEMLRNATQKGIIRVELGLPGGQGEPVWTETKLQRDSDGMLQLKQSSSNRFPRERLFVCGYGALRRSFGPKDYP